MHLGVSGSRAAAGGLSGVSVARAALAGFPSGWQRSRVGLNAMPRRMAPFGPWGADSEADVAC